MLCRLALSSSRRAWLSPTAALHRTRAAPLLHKRALLSSQTPAAQTITQSILYQEMTVGVPKETQPHEKRVAQTPETVKKLVALGIKVQVEHAAGAASQFADAQYMAAGATIVNTSEVWKSNLVFKVCTPSVLLHRLYINLIMWPQFT
jgi:Alanine dehydrogenase/PNT, N-terminal domain